MLAVDTNVIVRYLTRDDARQATRAAAAIDGAPIFVPTTVLLETEWVLRTLYQLAPSAICAALRTLLGQPTVNVEHAGVISAALAWAEQGMDLADALHVAASRGKCTAFVSFDRALAKKGSVVGMPIRAA